MAYQQAVQLEQNPGQSILAPDFFKLLFKETSKITKSHVICHSLFRGNLTSFNAS